MQKFYFICLSIFLEIVPIVAKKFNTFKTNFEKLYGKMHGPHSYERLVCSYYFGSFSFAPLPEDVTAINKLLKQYPLKVLDHIAFADGPRPDCAPAAVDCKPFKEKNYSTLLIKFPVSGSSRI